MRRQVSLEEISDGKLYGRNDMVRAGCNGCAGCSTCCRGMGDSVILDPQDVYRLTTGLGRSFEALLEDRLALNVVDGIILPNLRMDGEEETCGFLTPEGRCGIHPLRPGICRLFPLGRYYETVAAKDGAPARTFRYFLQIHECPAPNRTKVKVAKWIDTPDPARYERFTCDWHYFLDDVQGRIAQGSDEDARKINLLLLKLFFVRAYDGGRDFYGQFEERLATAREALGV